MIHRVGIYDLKLGGLRNINNENRSRPVYDDDVEPNLSTTHCLHLDLG